MRKMDIVYVLGTFPMDFENPKGGVESSTINLIKGLNLIDNLTLNFYLIVPRYNSNILNAPKNVKIINVKTKLSFKFYGLPLIGITKRIECIIKEINPDIVHVQGILSFYNPQKGSLLTIHGIPFIDSALNKFSLVNKLKISILKNIFYRNVNKYSDILLISTYLYNSILKDKLKNKKYHYVPNSINVPKCITPSEKGRKKLILFVSAIIRPLKNIETVLKIGDELKKNGIDFEIRIAGGFVNNEYEEKIKFYVDNLNLKENIKFLGYLSQYELNKHFLEVHLNILMSYQEVCPMSILEAQSYGIPSVTSFVGGIPDLIINGFNGYMFHPNDYENSSKLIFDIWKNRSKLALLSSNCLKVSLEYDNFEVAKTHNLLYKKILRLKSC